MTGTHKNYNVLNVTMPTYLQDIFRSIDMINLVYQKVHTSHVSCDGDAEPALINKSLDTNDLSLIGHPLEADLGDSVNFEVLEHGRRPNNWTKEEAAYGPIDLKSAREYLNGAVKSALQVCLCNVKDPRRILALFMQKNEFYRGTVNFYGCYALNQEEVSFGTMLQQHLRHCPKQSQVTVDVNTLYPIIGFNKRLAQDVMHRGVGNSAFVEVNCHDPMYKSTNNLYKLFLQVNAANPDSKFHPLWQQMNKIRHFIDQLQDEDDFEQIKIAENPKAFHEVADDITALLEGFKTKHYVHQGQFNWDQLNVLHMRDEDFLEKLWNCLISLDNLEDVCNSFHTLFTDLVETPINYTVPASNKTALGVIINGLIEGKMIIPTLTLPASLKFLVELGLNKLHNDYMFLIHSMEPRGEAHFKDVWEKIAQGSTQISKGASRKSRMTIPKGNENIGDLLKQLNHIAHMHLTTECMFLAERCKLSAASEALPQVYDQILKCKGLNKTFKTLVQSSVVDFECELLSNQFDRIKDLSAVSVNIKYFTEGRGKSSVTTIFHHSDKPIFPDAVFNDYGVDMDQIDNKKYYVHMAHILVN